MLDSAEAKPIFTLMIVYLLLSVMIPKMIQKPTGIQIIDNLVMDLNVQKGAYTSNLLMIGISMLITNYLLEESA